MYTLYSNFLRQMNEAKKRLGLHAFLKAVPLVRVRGGISKPGLAWLLTH